MPTEDDLLANEAFNKKRGDLQSYHFYNIPLSRGHEAWMKREEERKQAAAAAGNSFQRQGQLQNPGAPGGGQFYQQQASLQQQQYGGSPPPEFVDSTPFQSPQPYPPAPGYDQPSRLLENNRGAQTAFSTRSSTSCTPVTSPALSQSIPQHQNSGSAAVGGYYMNPASPPAPPKHVPVS